MAEQQLAARNWDDAIRFAEQGTSADPVRAGHLVAVAAYRLARRAALNGDFAGAIKWAERARSADPQNQACQEQLAMLRKAAGRVLRSYDERFFPDAIGSGSGQWWRGDLLERVRGWDGQAASVPAPTIMGEIRREHLEDVYAVGIYRPWHDGIPPKFTKWIRELKRHSKTLDLAAVLLYQGLTRDVASTAPSWIEEIGVVVPMATHWRSYEERGHELTEPLARELAAMLCVPYVDIFERSSEAIPTHHRSGYKPRVDALVDELRLKGDGGAALRSASGVLIVDDIVTYGATFEACARTIRAVHPHLRCWGAALAYTQTPVSAGQGPERAGVAVSKRGTLSQ